MTLWRVSNHRNLDGLGGLYASGRWHTKGRRIVYCAPDPATALLEVLVHADIEIADLPVRFRFFEIDVPRAVTVERIGPSQLGRNWQNHIAATRRIGDNWLRSGRTALLRVPSVLAPATWNTLINPAHPHSSRIRIVQTHRHALDRRLLK